MKAWDRACRTIDGCLEQGVREFVVCAGARNAALVEALARAEVAGRITLRHHFEERGAGFFALGRTMANGEPCAVVTTSGTAAAELLPALVEARYQGRPLVAITADRPARFRGSGAPQAIEQPGIFGAHAGSGEWADWDRRSPWHLNVELEEDFEPAEGWRPVPAAVRPAVEWPRLALGELAAWLRDESLRGVVVALAGLDEDDREEAYHFAMALGAPVVAEATSGLREVLGPLALADPDRELAARPPGKLLRLGAVPSGRWWRDLEARSEVEVWSVTRSGFPGLARESRTLAAPVARALRALGEVGEVGDRLDHLVATGSRRERIEELLAAHPESEAGMLRTLSHYAALGSSLYLGNSLPIREWNLFAQWERPLPNVHANRGANGIDGQIASWLGASASGENAWCLLGDLTALYDLASPALLRQVNRRGRVLAVIHNGGGRIFSRLPRLAAMSPRGREVMESPHQVSLEGWAAMWGLRYLRIEGDDDFDRLEPGGEPLLLELRPVAAESEAFWAAWAAG